MPKPNLVYLERVAEVQRITKEEQTRTGAPLSKIFHRTIDPRFRISIHTFRKYIAEPRILGRIEALKKEKSHE